MKIKLSELKKIIKEEYTSKQEAGDDYIESIADGISKQFVEQCKLIREGQGLNIDDVTMFEERISDVISSFADMLDYSEE